MAETTEKGMKNDLTRRLAHKALMPLVATAASAAAGYVAKKGPHLFEEKVLPKLKQTANGAGDTVGDLPSRAQDVVSSVGDMAGRAKDAVPLVGSAGGSGNGDDAASNGGGNGGNGGNATRRKGLSASDLEKHLKQRADARAARRKSTRR